MENILVKTNDIELLSRKGLIDLINDYDKNYGNEDGVKAYLDEVYNDGVIYEEFKKLSPIILAQEIIDEFEEILDNNNINIPDIHREGEESESRIYGETYYNLEDKITEMISNYI